MALRTRPHLFPVHCDIETKQIMRTSKMVATYTGIAVQASQPAPPLHRHLAGAGGDRRTLSHALLLLPAAARRPTRPSSERTRLHTSRASTSTACSCGPAEVASHRSADGSRHPPARHAQARGHVRDHHARVGRRGQLKHAGAGKALGQGCLPRAADRARVRSRPRDLSSERRRRYADRARLARGWSGDTRCLTEAKTRRDMSVTRPWHVGDTSVTCP